jgi:hyperosmotically inducible protein
MRIALVFATALSLLGCGTALRTGYSVATEERTTGEIVDDTAIVAKIKKAYLEESRENLLLTVFCHQGLVVLAGAVEDPRVGERAVRIARGVPGVKKVETYFRPQQPSAVSDFAISTKVKAKIVGDRELRLSQFDLTTIAGHVVLTGVVDRQEKIDKAIAYARSVDGVVAVRSFMQVKAQ